MNTPITPEKLIELGFTVHTHPIFEEECYCFPENLKLGGFFLNNDVILGWWVWAGWAAFDKPLRKVEHFYHLDNFVFGMTDEWLIELEEDSFIENTY